MNNIQKAFKQKAERGLRMRDGGSVGGSRSRSDSDIERYGLRMMGGGQVRGPGTGTSDSVPAMLSSGEYVLPADTVRAIGRENLDGLRAATHKPVEDSTRYDNGLRGGMPHMADGGALSSAWDWTKNAASNIGGGLRGLGSAPSVAAPAAEPVAAPAAEGLASGRPLGSSDWRSPIDTGRVSPTATAANSASEGISQALTRPIGLGSAAKFVAKSALPAAGAAYFGKSAYDDATAGDAAGATRNGLRAAASAGMLTPAAPVAGAYLAGDTIGSIAGNMLPDSVRDTIGGTINQGLRNISGGRFGVDDSAYLQLNSPTATPTLRTGAPAAPTGAPGAPTFNQAQDSQAANVAPAAAPSAPTSLRWNTVNAAPPNAGPVTGTIYDSNKGLRGRNITASGPAPDAGTIYGDPNNEYNTQVRQGIIADKNGVVHTPQGNGGLRAANPADPANAAISRMAAERDQLAATVAAAPGSGMKAAAYRGLVDRLHSLDGAMASVASTGITADANVYGHQLGLRQAMAQREWDRTKFGVEQDNKNREFGLQVDKEGREAHQQAVKGFTDQLGTMFTTKDDKGNVVPDTARVGDAMSKITEEVGARIKDLQSIAQTDPRYKQAQALSHRLSTQGMGALNDEDKRELLSQVAIRDQVNRTRGLAPGSSTAADSRLSGYAYDKTDPNLIGSDTVVLKNGSRIRQNDLRYTEPGNTILPNWGKVPTDRYDAGLRGGR